MDMMKKRILSNGMNFLILAVILFILQKACGIGVDQYYYDVGQYYSIGGSLFSDGHFSISAIANDFRGFVFPTYLGFCSCLDKIFKINNSIYFVSSVVLAVLLTVYLNFCGMIFGMRRDNADGALSVIVRNIFTVFLILFFFYGLIIYPLSDMYAALFCITSGFLVYRAANCNESGCKRYIEYFFAGFFLYLTYNIRTIYQLSIFAFVIIIIIFEINKKGGVSRAICSNAIFIIGVLSAAIPQFIINWNKYEIISPWINNQNLFAQQLYWGLQYSRYATWVGDAELHTPGMYFVDSTGMQITSEWSGLNLPITIKSYVMMFFKFPLEYIAIIGKHVWNAFFVLFPEQYILDLNENRVFYAVVSLLIIFAFCVLLFKDLKLKKVEVKNMVFMLSLAFPSIAIMFGAVEERFMLLPYLLIYGYISFYDYKQKKLITNVKTMFLLVLLFIAFLTSAVAIESEILSSLNGTPISFTNQEV